VLGLASKHIRELSDRPYLASRVVRNNPAGPACQSSAPLKLNFLIESRSLLTPITTTSYRSSPATTCSGIAGDNLGRGGANEGRIRRSREALEVSVKTGIVTIVYGSCSSSREISEKYG
jgi:hypothetical protein